MDRRNFLRLGAATIACPAIGRAQSARTLRFVPYADLALLDPILTTNYVTRAHAQIVFETLYGMDETLAVRPQMIEADSVSDDGRLWRLTLRSGLLFHDGTPVLSRDIVASLKRWAQRDAFGSALFSVVDEISAPDDKVVAFRLSRPFPLLREALAKPTSYLPVIMPARLAATSPFTAVPEIIGSGPYRFAPEERVAGSLNVYKRFDAYKPRSEGSPSFTAGPRIAHFERLEWLTMPDGNTAASALKAGEIDWWEQPNVDLLPVLSKDQRIKIDVRRNARADRTNSAQSSSPAFRQTCHLPCPARCHQSGRDDGVRGWRRPCRQTRAKWRIHAGWADGFGSRNGDF